MLTLSVHLLQPTKKNKKKRFFCGAAVLVLCVKLLGTVLLCATRSPHLRLLQPIIRNSERKRRLGVNLAPIKFHIFYQVRFWYPLETNVDKVFMTIY